MFARFRFACLGLLVVLCPAFSVQGQNVTQNVLVVMTDGLRRQEVFSGADEKLLAAMEEHQKDAAVRLRKDYWRATPEERRQVLMPFLWTTIAKQGQLYGDQDHASQAYVTNGLNFSYPGYSETLVGYADPKVKSNDNVQNPNVTVLEWLNKQPRFQGKVAAFGAWAVIDGILSSKRCGFVVNAGYEPFVLTPMSSQLELLNRWKVENPHVWEDEPFDAPVFYTAVEYLKEKKPRVLYLSLGETDDWAHGGRYGDYLDAAHRFDTYLEKLWNLVQSMPEYRGKTSLVVLTDHGRGATIEDWRDHGTSIPQSKYIWMAFLGPDTQSLGVRANVKPVTQNQTAATIAALLGQNYKAAFPAVGNPITEVLASGVKEMGQ